MIIECLYSTDTDIGLFESPAKLNTQTGEVFDIKPSEGDDMENIDMVVRTYVEFTYKNKKIECDVEDTGEIYSIASSPEFIEIFAEKLENHLPVKKDTRKKKI